MWIQLLLQKSAMTQLIRRAVSLPSSAPQWRVFSENKREWMNAPWTCIDTHAEGKTLRNHTRQRTRSKGWDVRSSIHEELLQQIIYKSRTRRNPGRNGTKATNMIFALKQRAESSYLQLNYTRARWKRFIFDGFTSKNKYFISRDELDSGSIRGS